MRLVALRAELVRAIRALAAADLWHEGASASCRDAATGCRLVAPAGIVPASLRPRDLLLWSAAGECLEGRRPPPPDVALHLRVYAAVPRAGALVLTRPPLAAVLADEALGLPPVSRRLAALGGGIRCLPYAPRDSEALARLVADALGRRRACLLAAFGVAAEGPTIAAAAAAVALVERVGGPYAAARLAGLRPRHLGEREMAHALRYAGPPLRRAGERALMRGEEMPWRGEEP